MRENLDTKKNKKELEAVPFEEESLPNPKQENFEEKELFYISKIGHAVEQIEKIVPTMKQNLNDDEQKKAADIVKPFTYSNQ